MKPKSNTLKTNIYLLLLLLSSCVQDNYIARSNDYPSSWIPNILDKFQEGRSRYVASSMTFPENLILFSGTRSDSLHFSLNSILLFFSGECPTRQLATAPRTTFLSVSSVPLDNLRQHSGLLFYPWRVSHSTTRGSTAYYFYNLYSKTFGVSLC